MKMAMAVALGIVVGVVIGLVTGNLLIWSGIGLAAGIALAIIRHDKDQDSGPPGGGV